MMAKLYWRVKMNGKWTWRPASVYSDNARTTIVYNCVIHDYKLEEEE